MSDKEFTRKTSKAIVVCTTPDVCKSPTTPTPYISYAVFDEVIETADSVRMTRFVTFTEKSRISTTHADEGGVGGGLKSQTNKGMCRPYSEWSTTVRAEGEWICRHEVIMEVNCLGPEGPGNTYGKVFYIESLSCARVSDDGEIVIDDRTDQPTDTSDATSSPTSPPSSGSTAAPPPAAPSTADKIGEFGSEAGDRAKQRLGEAKEALENAAEGAYEAAKEAIEDPAGAWEKAKKATGEAIDEAIEGAQEAYEEVKEKGPIAYGEEKAGEWWEQSDAKKDLDSGNYGGLAVDGAIEAATWFFGGMVAKKVAKKLPTRKKKPRTSSGSSSPTHDPKARTPDASGQHEAGSTSSRDGESPRDGGRVSNSHKKAAFGERTAHQEMSKKGYEPVGDTDGAYKPGQQGIDGVYKNPSPPPDYVITEVKAGSGQLQKGLADGTNQMDDTWVRQRLESKVGMEEAARINQAMDEGSVEKWLIKVRDDGTATARKVDELGNAIRGNAGEVPGF